MKLRFTAFCSGQILMRHKLGRYRTNGAAQNQRKDSKINRDNDFLLTDLKAS